MSYPHSGPVVTTKSPVHEVTEETHGRMQMEIIARLNNLGVACIDANDQDPAGHFFRRALEKARETTFFSIPQPPSSNKGTEVSKSLYIYQRGEYDEGMHTFSEALMMDGNCKSMHRATAIVLYNQSL